MAAVAALLLRHPTLIDPFVGMLTRQSSDEVRADFGMGAGGPDPDQVASGPIPDLMSCIRRSPE